MKELKADGFTTLYYFVFLAEEFELLVSVKECNVYSDVFSNGKYLELKTPEGGRIKLKKTLSLDLTKELRNKIHYLYGEGQTEFNIDELYEEVVSQNTKKYLVHKGVVKTKEGFTISRNIYSTGKEFWYLRNKVKAGEDKEWTEVFFVSGQLYEEERGLVRL